MSYSMQHWRRAWDNAQRGIYANDDATKTLDLLSKYAGFYKSFLAFGVVGKSHYGRFFSGRWYTQHANQVESAIANFYHVDGMCRLNEQLHSVEYILALVKQKMVDRPINPEGNLARVLDVIRERTGVDYANLDANVIIGNYEHEPRPIDPPIINRILPAENSSSSTQAQYSQHLQTYIDSFDGKLSFQAQLDELSLTESEQKEVDDRFTCFISSQVINIPVSLNLPFRTLRRTFLN